MNQTSLVGRPLYNLTRAVGEFIEKRSSWSGPLTSSSPELARLWGAPVTSTGVAVNESSALTYSAFWACVNNISTDVASLPLFLYKRLPNGGKEKLADHKLYRILHDAPNSEMDAMQFRETLQGHVLTWGNGYAEIIRDGSGSVRELWPLTPDRVSVKRDPRTYRLYYEVARLDGGIDAIPSENMFHLHGLGYDGTYGYSVVAHSREDIALGLASEKFGGTFFGNGATFGGVISIKTPLTEQAQESFRRKMEAQHAGVEHAHKFLLLGNDATYTRLGIPPNDAQFLETRQFQVEEICRWFRMPPHKIQHLLRSTNNNIEHQSLEYYVDTIRPWCVRWEHAIKRKLVAPSERTIQFAKHNMEGVLRGDAQTRSTLYASGRQWGYYSANDVRELEDLNPIAGGDAYLTPTNMSPADRLDEIVDAQVRPDPAPVAPQAQTAVDEADRAQKIADWLGEQLVMLDQQIRAHVDLAVKAERAAHETKWKEHADAIQLRADAFRTKAEEIAAERRRVEDELELAVAEADRLRTEKESALAVATESALEMKRAKEEMAAELVRVMAKAQDAETERDAVQALRDAALVVADKVSLEHAQAIEALRAAAESERNELADRVADLDAKRIEAERHAQAHSAKLEQADAELGAAQARNAEIQAQMDALLQQAEATPRVIAEAENRASDALANATLAQSEAERLTAELAAEMAAKAEFEKQLADVQAYADAIKAKLEAAEADAAKAVEAAVTVKAEAERETADLTAKLVAEQEARTAAEAEKAQLAKAEADRVQAQMTANRDLVADAVGRLVIKETERARKNKATPAKLKAWMDGFYLLHEETSVEHLRPSMRTHLASIGSKQDVDAYILTKIRPHLQAAMEQLRAVASGDPDEFQIAIERLLTRWEQERPAAIADDVLQEEIAHVRSLKA